MKIFNEMLKCGLENVDIEDKNTVTLYLTEGHCSDMDGAIKLSSLLTPDVRTINTISGNEADTVYLRQGSKWKVIERE